jgi:hypothetical protein
VSYTEPLTLPIRCVECGQPVTVSYRPEDAYRSASWTCPYLSCKKANPIALRGRILSAVARYEPPTA